MTMLATKAALGLAQLALILGLALFVPAWTFRYWQAWLCLLVFLTSSALITVYLWKRDPSLLAGRLNAGPRAEKEALQQRIQAFAAAAFLGIFLLSSLDHRFSWSHIPPLLVLAADALMLLSFLIVFRVFQENTFTVATIQVTSDQKVISTGPYSVVRHPMYAAALVLLFAIPIALGSAWALLMLIPMTILLIQRLLAEEQFLSTHLPGYQEYCQKVPHHLIPRIW